MEGFGTRVVNVSRQKSDFANARTRSQPEYPAAPVRFLNDREQGLVGAPACGDVMKLQIKVSRRVQRERPVTPEDSHRATKTLL